MVNNPIIYDIIQPVTSLNITLSGEVSGFVEDLVCYPSGGNLNFNEISGITYWSYDLELSSNYTPFSIYAIDSLGDISETAYLDIYYEIPQPIIYGESIVTDQIDNLITGESSGEISGFIFSPTGGIFTSGSISGNTFWGYQFAIMSPITQFNIQSFDRKGILSESSLIDIEYNLKSPVILNPGTPRTLTDSVAISGSTSNTFNTLNGNFKNDGVVVGDLVLSVSGKNISTLRSVTEVDEKFIKFDDFSETFEQNDEIKIYKNQERPNFKSNKLDVNFSGKVSQTAKKVIFSSTQYSKPRIYSSINSNVIFPSGFSTLHFVIDGEDEIIDLDSDTELDLSQVVTKINSFFSKEVAFLDSDYLYIEGSFLEVKNSSANTILGFFEGSWTLAYSLSVQNSFTLDLIDPNIISFSVDGNVVLTELQLQSLLFSNDIVNTINSSLPKKICSYGPSKIIILGNELIKINSTLPQLGMLPNVIGSASYINETFNFHYRFQTSSLDINIYVIDYFYRLSFNSSSLALDYKIDLPILLTSNLNVSQNRIKLNGEYDSEGVGVFIEDTLVGSNGIWSYEYSNLMDGNNDINISTQDIFGSYSENFNFIVNFTDPNNLPLELDPPVGSNLEWTLGSIPTLAPEELEKLINSITQFFDPIIENLENAKSILKLVRAFIVDYVGNPITLLKNAIQQILDNILDLIDAIFNGAGFYFLNTIPIDASSTLDAINRMRGGFDGMIDTIIRSIDDPLDPNRPRLTDNASVGGYVIAISDSGNVNNFFNALSGLIRLFRNEIFDKAISYPQNLKAEEENSRVILTWQSSGGGIAPMNWFIYRATTPNGNPIIDPGEIPKPDGTSIPVGVHRKDINGEPMYDWGKPIGYVKDWQVWKEFKFIDGVITEQESGDEKKLQQKIDDYLNLAIDSINSLEDIILVSTGSSNGKIQDYPTNGQVYYYKVVGTYDSYTDALEDKSIALGQSFIVSATPKLPNLILVEETYLSINSKDFPDDKTKYQLAGAIYNKDTGNYSQKIDDIKITVDNKSSAGIKSWFPSKGFIEIDKIPEEKITVKYWTVKEPSLTRAKLTGSVKSDVYEIKNDKSNELKIQVGRVTGLVNYFGDSARGAELNKTSNALKNIQTIKLKDFSKGESSFILTIDQVMEAIRSQLYGVKVYKNKTNQIIIVDNQSPDIYRGSYLKVHQTNSVLGFVEGQESTAGPTSGISPDWSRLAMSDLFPVLKDTFSYIENVLQQISRSLESASNALIDFIDLLIRKVESLLSIISRLEQLLIQLVQSLTLSVGVYVLEIPNNLGGNNYIKNCLLNSTNRPLGDYAAGIVLLYTDGGTRRALDLIFSVD